MISTLKRDAFLQNKAASEGGEGNKERKGKEKVKKRMSRKET